MQLYTIQSFSNAIIGGSQQDFSCLHQHLSPYLLENMSAIGSWQEYLVNMALPYEKGNVEGCRFYLKWLSIIFRVNIQVWSALPDGTVHSWSIDLNYDQTIDILSLKTDTTHIIINLCLDISLLQGSMSMPPKPHRICIRMACFLVRMKLLPVVIWPYRA
jgi:hypothetical protein